MSLSSEISSTFFCESCHCNKSHRLPFGQSSLKSCGPFDLVYTDVWGPFPVMSINGYKYYVIFVDHFTKYIWLYPLCLKSVIVDSGRCTNVVSEEMVTKLGLRTEKHPKPYNIHWLQDGEGMKITHRSLVSFSIGKTYCMNYGVM